MKSKKSNFKLNKIVIVVAIIIVIAFAWTLIKSFSVNTETSAWDGVIARSFTSGTGTEKNPYVISSAAEFAYFKQLMESEDANVYANKNYVITKGFNYGENDISINNTVAFSGTIDGNYNLIYNAVVTNYLFALLDGATIKNINYNEIDATVNSNTGIFVNEMSDSNITGISLIGTAVLEEEIEETPIVAGIAYSDNNSVIDSVVLNIENELDSYVSLVYDITDTEFNNVIVSDKYDKVNENVNIDLSNVSEIDFDNVTLTSLTDAFDSDDYVIFLDNDVIMIGEKEEEDTSGETTEPISSGIVLHNSGIDTGNKSIYINDLDSDYNYYIGRNYTQISNTNGTIPSGNNQNLYSDSNLATVYIRYSSADINDSSIYGAVSVSEDIRNYYYYKRIPVKNGKVTFDLIDNPWARRPNNRAFNGWVTDYTGAVVSLDTDVYVRSVSIPVSDTSSPISITFYTSWTVASLATSTNQISTNLKSVTMQELPGDYGDLTQYYISDHINRNASYPSGTLYNMRGTLITRTTCNTYGGCDFVRPNTSNEYDSNESYYTVTPINNSNNVTLTRVYPSKVSAVAYYDNGGSAAGLFIKVTSGNENIYNASGDKQSSCSGTCYKLLQYSDGSIVSSETYYYLPTRDTNIFVPSSTNTVSTSNITTSVPMTITGINNGTDNSNNRTIQLNNNWTINSDLRIEFIRFYVNETSTNVTNFSNNGYKIVGNFKNLKLGRGLKQYSNGNTRYLTATSFIGGNSSSTGSLTKYSLIVESGFYQNGSATGYSSYNHYVQGNIILGSDYDRIGNNNDSLIVYYCYAGSWGSSLSSTDSSTNTYDVPAVYSIIKSGSFGTNKNDYAAGVYVGGRSGGTHYALREILVEGGYIYNLIGGPASSSSRSSKNDIIINVKGGSIDLVLGGAGASNTVGNRILNITGGTINYSVLGGSNANEYGTGTSDPYGKIDGDTLVYVGGNVIVGTKTDELFTVPSGDVYGAGNGRSGEWDVGAVNNSHVIIGPTATIKGDVYGGGNNGAVGGNTVGTVSLDGDDSSAVTSGVYEDGTTDNSIRYYGNSPDNYIQFNGELYRIIGLFNNVNTSNGSKNLIRIVKNTSLGNRAWGDANMSTVETNTSTETESGWFSDNTYNYTNYYKNYYNFFVKNDNTTSNMYNYLNTTYFDGLNSTYKNYIEEVNWGLGATAGVNQTASELYTAERGTGVVNYLTGINQTANGNSLANSSFKVGLFYPSDYGFANNNSTCLDTNLGSYTSSCRTNNWMSGMTNAWTMTPSTNVTSVTREYQVSRSGSGWTGYTYTMNRYYHVSNRNFIIGNNGLELRDIYYTTNENDANNYYNTGAVYPSFYLKENVTISSGTGTSDDPYIIGSSDNKLTDIVYELMHPTVVEPEEPVVVTFEDSDYQSFTHIQILGGSIEGSVFGAGNSNGAGNNTKGSNGKVALSKVTIDMKGGSVGKSIYGGSNELGTVYGDVFINVENGDIGESVYGGGKGGYSSSEDGTYVACNVNVNIGSNTTTNLTIHDSVYGGSAFGSVNTTDQNSTSSPYATLVTVNDGVIVGSVFGGGEGDSSYTPQVVGPITVTINDGDITNVFGGNDQAGSHTKLNRVYLNGGTVDNVYGGGNKSSVTNTHVFLQGSTVTNLYGGSNTLGDVSTTSVQIKSGTVQKAYGGNNEGGTCGTTDVKVQGTASVNGSLYGGGNQVDTTTTNITLISASSTIPNVYGGGNSASVGTTNITKNGVNVTNLFGGSNSTGIVTTSNIDHSGGITTNLYGGNNAGGNTLDSKIDVHNGSITTLYGGGNKANGNTSTIVVDGGTTTTIFGGGNNAGLESSNVTVSSGSVTDIYGGSNNNGKVNTTNITLDGTSGIVNSLYGGGNKAEVGTTNVVVNAGTINNIFGGGNLAQVTGNTLLDINGGTMNGSVYGGGNFGVVKGSSTVTITDTTILGSAYAGGNGTTATLEGNTSITIDGNTVVGNASSVPPASGSVFGGGNQAYTGIESNNNSTSTVNIVSGTFYGNIYGGANTSVIYGSTNVNIGKNTVNDNSLKSGDVHIKGHIFGGGEANASGSEIYDWNFISVTQGTNINIDGNNHTNFAIDGSFYGGGNASSASGTSYLSIKNYGTVTSPKNNISIQRVNYVTIDNSALLLNGATDRANEFSSEKFSISRVTNLKLKNNSTIFFAAKTNLLESFESLDSSGNKATVTIDEDNNTVTKSVDNRIYLFEGKDINVATDQQAKEPGNVTGMTFMGLFNFDNDKNINTGIYNPTYAAGDLLDWTGTFTRGSTVFGSHLTNHDITVDGFYSNYINEETAINEVKYVRPSPSSADYYLWAIGESVIEYNIDLVASKYSTLGSKEYVFRDYNKPNTSFQILSFDASEIAEGVTLVDRNDIPRIASSADVANNQFGLAIEASNTGWLTSGKTSFYTSEPSINGITYYEGENSSNAPTMLFYLYHSKNLSEAKDLGTVRISMMTITRINALSNEVSRLVLNVNMSTALFQTNEYEGSMTAGDKYELFTSTATNITTKSKLSTYYSLYASNENIYKTGYHRALVSSFVFPENTKLTMLDFVNGVPEYYYHIIDSADVQRAQAEYDLTLNSEKQECSYPLSMFTKMGSKSNNSNYNDATMNGIYYNGTDSNEEFIFIVDYADTSIENTQLNNSLTIEMRDEDDETKFGVLGVQRADLTYNLYANSDAMIDMSITESVNPLYIGYSDVFDVLINYQGTSVSGAAVTDTQYFDSKLGLQVYITNNEGHMVSGTDLTGTYFLMEGVKYYPDIDGITHIKLSDKVGNTEKWITFNTENSSLATGSYSFVFETFGSPDGIYYSDGSTDEVTKNINIINTTYGFKPEINQNSVIFNGTGNNKNLVFSIDYESRLSNPNIRLAMYRRKYNEIYDTNYELVDLQSYVSQSLFTTNNQKEYLIVDGPSSTNNATIMLKEELLTGTYRLSFRLYDGDTMIGEVVRYIVIK